MATKKKTAKIKLEKKAKPKLAKKLVAKKKALSVVVPVPSEEKLDIIKQFQVKEGDTGSPEVQVALLTKRIEKLVGHLKSNPSDNHSRRGLLGLVSKRRRLLHYLEQKDQKRFKGIAQKLGLGK
jgi:small subunit ribosomal protein S15